MKKKYYGIIPPIISPVDCEEQIDSEGYKDLLEYCIEGGLHGIFAAGTNGETMALTQKERERIIKITLEQVNGRVPVIAGVMDSSTKRVIENIKAVEAMGGNCVAVTSIFYDRHTSQEETVRHFEKILSETTADLVIYNIPAFTGIKLNADTVIRIAELDKRVVAYKDSSGSYGEFMEVLNHFQGTDFSVMQGVTGQALSAVLMGICTRISACVPGDVCLRLAGSERKRCGAY